jgi:hypothetical protein
VRKFLAVTAAAAAASMFVAAIPAAADASVAGRPAVTFSFTQESVTAGTQPQIVYSAKNLPSGSGIFLQVRYGPTLAWTYVETLSAGASTASVPAMSAGIDQYRVRALDNSRMVAVSPARFIDFAPTPGSSSCTACQLFGGIGGAVVTFVLSKVPWQDVIAKIASWLPW